MWRMVSGVSRLSKYRISAVRTLAAPTVRRVVQALSTSASINSPSVASRGAVL